MSKQSPYGNAAAKPSQWPDNVQYLTKPRYSSRLPTSHIAALRGRMQDVDSTSIVSHADSKLPCTRVKIKPITTASHPAYKQHGLFAAQHLAPSSFILLYLGFIHGSMDADSMSSYDLSLDREHDIGIDSTREGNEARFMNDYRGVAEGPNAEFRDCWIEVGGGVIEKRVGVYVLPAGKKGRRAKGIGKGEEILVSYGKGFWKGVEVDVNENELLTDCERNTG